VLHDQPLKPHSVLLRDGIAELKAAGADVVLIDMQFAPRVQAKPETQGMEEQIARAAKEANVDLFNRFAPMRDWQKKQHRPFNIFLSP
jgi:acyl-CoA thioesterase I